MKQWKFHQADFRENLYNSQEIFDAFSFWLNRKDRTDTFHVDLRIFMCEVFTMKRENVFYGSTSWRLRTSDEKKYRKWASRHLRDKYTQHDMSSLMTEVKKTKSTDFNVDLLWRWQIQVTELPMRFGRTLINFVPADSWWALNGHSLGGSVFRLSLPAWRVLVALCAIKCLFTPASRFRDALHLHHYRFG